MRSGDRGKADVCKDNEFRHNKNAQMPLAPKRMSAMSSTDSKAKTPIRELPPNPDPVP